MNRDSEDRLSSLDREKLHGYLGCLALQDEPGLIVVDHENLLEAILEVLKSCEMAAAWDWEEAFENLREGRSTFLVIEKEFPKELYDMIAQYYKRPGTMQIMDKRSMEIQRLSIDKEETTLLLVARAEDLKSVEKRYSIRDKVGLTERF